MKIWFCWTTFGNNITYWKKWPSHLRVNPTGAEAVIFLDNMVNTMAANALAPCVIRPSAAKKLTMWDEQVPKAVKLTAFKASSDDQVIQLAIISVRWEGHTTMLSLVMVRQLDRRMKGGQYLSALMTAYGKNAILPK